MYWLMESIMKVFVFKRLQLLHLAVVLMLVIKTMVVVIGVLVQVIGMVQLGSLQKLLVISCQQSKDLPL